VRNQNNEFARRRRFGCTPLCNPREKFEGFWYNAYYILLYRYLHTHIHNNNNNNNIYVGGGGGGGRGRGARPVRQNAARETLQRQIAPTPPRGVRATPHSLSSARGRERARARALQHAAPLRFILRTYSMYNRLRVRFS